MTKSNRTAQETAGRGTAGNNLLKTKTSSVPPARVTGEDMVQMVLRGRLRATSVDSWAIFFKRRYDAEKHGQLPELLVIDLPESESGTAVRAALWERRARLHAILAAAAAPDARGDHDDAMAASLHLPVRVRLTKKDLPKHVRARLDKALSALASSLGVSPQQMGAKPMRKRKRIGGVKAWWGQAVPALRERGLSTGSSSGEEEEDDDDEEGGESDEDEGRGRRGEARGGGKKAKSGSAAQGPINVKPLEVVLAGEGAAALLPGQSNRDLGGVFGMFTSTDDKERPGRVGCVTCVFEPGSGRLVVSGNVVKAMRDSAVLARSFLQVHEAWLEQRVGPLALRPTSVEHDVFLHVEPGVVAKTGVSLGAGMIVALASMYSGRAPVVPAGILGTASLSGGMGAVCDLARKLTALEKRLAGRKGLVAHALVPMESVQQRAEGARRYLVEQGDMMRGEEAYRPQVSATTKSRLRLVAVRSLFECIEVMLLPPPAANALPAAMPPPAGLECVRALLALDTTKGVGGGVPALVQCARVPRPSHMDSPPHPDVTCTADLQEATEEQIQVAVRCVRLGWEALVRDKWAPRPVQGDPSATDHNLHVHVAGPMADPRVGLAVATATMALYLGRAVPAHVAMVGEVNLAGGVTVGPIGQELGMLRLAAENEIRVLVVPKHMEAPLNKVIKSNRRSFEGLHVAGVTCLADVMDVLLLE